VSLSSLAKYVTAERPIDISHLPEDRQELVREINDQAREANDGIDVIQVGGIFADLVKVFQKLDPTQDLRSDTAAYQAGFEDWGYEPRSGDKDMGERLIVRRLEGENLRDAAIDAIKAIAEQGEGFDEPSDNTESHFERFLFVYEELREAQNGNPDWQPAWPLTTNPNTTGPRKKPPRKSCPVTTAEEDQLTSGRITNPRSHAWAQLFNLRYRMLLNYLQHFLLFNEDSSQARLYLESGDRTPRGLLLIWTFNEMRRVKRIAERLVEMPKDKPDGDENAGPPFELPFTLNLPDRDTDRWRTHYDVSKRSSTHIQEQIQGKYPEDKDDPFLQDLLKADEATRGYMKALALGQPLPLQATMFQKVVRILEEAVRGFDIGFHGNFWHCLTRDEFVNDSIPRVGKLISDDLDPDTSPLIHRLEGKTAGGTPVPRMPRSRPPVPAQRIEFIRDWIASDGPDNEPPNKPGIVREGNRCEAQVEPPAPEPQPPVEEPIDPQSAREQMVQLLRSKRPLAEIVHVNVAAGDTTLAALFEAEAYDAILAHLQTAESALPPFAGTPLVIAGKPEDSGFYKQANEGVMRGAFQPEELSVIHRWITSLQATSETPEGSPERKMLDLIRQKRDQGAINPIHAGVTVGQSNLSNLFQQMQYSAILEYLKVGTSREGNPLIVAGKPEESVFFQKITNGGMRSFFDQQSEVPIVRDWIMSLVEQ
jgi:hypothetical protein